MKFKNIKGKKFKKPDLKLNLHSFMIVGVTLLLLIPFGIAFTSLLSRPVEAAWFDPGYGYRKKIPVSNSSGTAQIDFQTQLTLDTATLITAGKMQSNCNDNRFTDISGKVLSYWIEPNTCNTASTLIWVKVSSIPTSGTQIYWYYGNPSASSQSVTMPTFLRDMPQAAAAWPLDDTTATQSYSRDINPALATGRNIIIDPGFDDASKWSTGAGWTISGGLAHCNEVAGSNLSQATTMPVVIGKAYTITYTILNYVSGGVSARVGSTAATTTRNANGTYTETIVATGTQSAILFAGGAGMQLDIDNVSLVEINIPASTATPTQLLADGNMEAVGTAAWPATAFTTATKQSGTRPGGSGTQVIRVAGDGVHNPYAYQLILTVGQVYRVTGWARSDGTTATPRITDNTGNFPWVGTSSIAWQPFDVVFKANVNQFDLYVTGAGAGNYAEFDDVTVSLDTGIRPDANILSTLDGDMETVPTSGTATSGGVATMTDSSKTWVTNIYANQLATIIAGTGSGQTRLILSNTVNSVSFSAPWTVSPDNTSQYQIIPYWALNGNVAISKETNSPHGGTYWLKVLGTAATVNPNASINIFTPGKTYRITGWYRGDGVAQPRVLINGASTSVITGTNSTNWQSFDVVVVPTGTSLNLAAATGTTQFAGFDDISVSEVPPLVGLPANGVTLGSATGAGGHLTNAYSFDGTNDLVNIYSGSLNSAFNPNEGTVVAWAKYTGSWSDNNARFILTLRDTSTGNNYFELGKDTNNKIGGFYNLNSSSGLVEQALTPSGWFQVAMTWSKSNDQVKIYYNGSQIGTTQTGLGTWAANLGAANTTIGALDTSGSHSWSGVINDVRLYPRALTSGEISDQYNAGWDTQTYTTANYPGQELLRKYANGTVTTGSLGVEETTPGAGLYWAMEQGQGSTVYDTTKSTNNGTLSGTTPPTWQTPDVCALGQCLYFDGISSKVTGTRISKGVSTVSFWIKPNKAESLGIINFDGGTHKISTNTSGVVTATGWSSPTYYLNGVVSTTPTLIANAWNHVEITTASGFDTTNTFTLGTDGSNFVQGYIDELKFYPYARTSIQVNADYTGVAESLGQFSQKNQQVSGLVAQWPLDDSVATQSYDRVVNPGVTTGRNIAIDGDFANSPGPWSLGTGVTISVGTANFAAVAAFSGLTDTSNPGIVAGKVYQATYTVSNYVSGSFKIAVGSTGSGTTRSANGTYTENIIAAGTSRIDFLAITTFTGSVDNITVTELNIPTSPTTQPTQLLADGDMEAGTTAAWSINQSALLSKVSGSAHSGNNVLRVTYNGTIAAEAYQNILTTGLVYRVTGYMRSDGTAIPKVTTNGTLVSVTGTNSTAWQPFDFLTVATAPGVTLRNNTASGFVEFDDVVVAQDNYVRSGNVIVNGTFDADDGSWTKGTGWTISGGVANASNAAAGQNLISTNNTLVIGKTYTVTWTLNFTSGLVALHVGTTAGPTRSSSGTFTETLICAGQTTLLFAAAGFTGTIDNVTVTEVPPMVGIPTNGVVLGASTGGGHGQTAASFDGTNDNVNIYSGSLNSEFNPNEGTLIAWAKVSGSGVWSDATLRRIFVLQTDSNNFVLLGRNTSTNQLIVQYDAGGTVKNVTDNSLVGSTNWFQLVITYSKSNDQVKMFINGNQVGATQNGLGTWTGNLISTGSVIGASGSSALNPWSGLINDVRLYNRALTAKEIFGLYGSGTAGGPVGWWKMDEGTGTTSVDSASGNNISLLNTPAWTQGQYGKALNLNGVNQYAETASSNLWKLTPNSTTISMWVYPQSASNKNILSYLSASTEGWRIQSTQGAFSYSDSTGPASNCVSRNAGLPLNTWSYLTYIINRDTNTISCYFNGQINGPPVAMTMSITGGPSTLVFGARHQGGTLDSFFTGSIDDVKIYNYVRSQSQILEDMNGSGSGALAGANTGELPKPQGYWKFDEGFGTTTANFGIAGTLNGTLTNMSLPATSTSGWSNSGKFNKALSFDGSNDNVNMGDPTALRFTSSGTVDAWIYPTSYDAGTGYAPVLIKGNWGGGLNGYFIYYQSSDTTLRFEIDGASVVSRLSVSRTLTPLNTWSHVLMSWDGSKIYGYVNGNLVGSVTESQIPDTSTFNFIVGANAAGGTFPFAGRIDEVRAYNTALTADQVKLEYNDGVSENFGANIDQATLLNDGAGAAPVAYWNFDEKTNSTVNDKSGNNNTGTWQGTLGSQWTVGKIGAAGSFNGTDNDVQVTALTTTYNVYSVSAWVKTSQANSNYHAILRNPYNQAHNNYSLFIRNGKAQTYDYINNSIRELVSNKTVADGLWHHINSTYDGTTLKIYIDGNLDNSLTISGTLAAAGTTWMGNDSFGNLFAGQIDDVKVYNYARTAAQVAYDYDRGAPVALWKFDECKGSTAFDLSGNPTPNNATITIGGTGSQTSVGDCQTAGTAWGNGASGKYSSSLSFDGSDDYVSIPSSAPRLNGSFTITAWVKTNTLTPVNTDAEIMNDWGGFTKDYLLDQENASFRFIVGNGSTLSDPILQAGTPVVGKWQFVTGLVNGTTHILYVDAKQVASQVGSYSGGVTANTRNIGSDNAASFGYSFNGSIDDVRMYNYALSQSQINQVFNQGAAVRFGPTTGSP